ncbi:hypothetical protein [Azospirillum sp. sgz302134]
MRSGRFLTRLLRLILGRAASAAGSRRHGYGHGHGYGRGRSHEDVNARAALALARCRRALAEARAERQQRVADLLRYGKARDVLMERVAAAPAGPERDGLQRSLATLEDRLTEWFDQLDALDARIARLESDLAFLKTMAGEGPEEPGPRQERARERPAGPPPPDAEQARHLAALGLTALPASLVELKAAYRARLKAVHPDLGAQGSTEATAAATVAFAELRKNFVGR